jgi:hypothetical protein
VRGLGQRGPRDRFVAGRGRPGRSIALHALDSLHLAATLVAAESRPASLEFACLDDRLRVAAVREGFAVVPS